MKQKLSAYRVSILDHLSSIPENIAALHGTENIADFVIHHLCHSECFNFNKAAYFIDNPDFDHFKGVTGYQATQHAYESAQQAWHHPETFTEHMKQSLFNKRVRETQGASHHKKNHDTIEAVRLLAQTLNLKNPQYCSWNLKNDNHGLFIFQEDETNNHDWYVEDLKKGLALFNFCPIF